MKVAAEAVVKVVAVAEAVGEIAGVAEKIAV